jgi:hypothetical protein
MLCGESRQTLQIPQLVELRPHWWPFPLSEAHHRFLDPFQHCYRNWSASGLYQHNSDSLYLILMSLTCILVNPPSY